MGVPPALRMSLFVACLTAPLGAAGEPVVGPSVYGGISFHHTEPAGDRPGDSYGSSGLSFGVDYQTPMGPSFSVVPFAALSLENSDNAASQRASVTSGVAAMEGRAWYGSFFMGAHGGYYMQELEYGDESRRGAGLGWGLTLGTRPAESMGAALADGTYVMVQIDHGKNIDVGAQPDTNMDIKALRLFMGYRLP